MLGLDHSLLGLHRLLKLLVLLGDGSAPAVAAMVGLYLLQEISQHSYFLLSSAMSFFSSFSFVCISPLDRQTNGLLFRLVLHNFEVSLSNASASELGRLEIFS